MAQENKKNSPTIVLTKKSSQTKTEVDFQFTPDMVRETTASPIVNEYRQNAWKSFSSTPMPTIKDEAWRRTDLSGLQVPKFRFPAKSMDETDIAIPDNLTKNITGDEHGGQVILFPGGSTSTLNDDLRLKGVIFEELKDAEKNHPKLLEKIIGKIIKPEEGKFASFAGAMGQTGVLLYVPKGITIDKPLHSLLWGPGADLVYVSHILVYLEEDSSVTYVHEAASPKEENGQKLHAGLVEIFVGPNAKLRWVELQSWGENVWNFSHERVQVDVDGEVDWIFGAIGSHLTKNFSDLELSGRGSVGRVSGFYFTDGKQHMDHDTQQNHLAPHTTSDLLFKGALVGESRSVWQGMIYVAPGAFKTDGYQANRNLVLSSKARADSIPGLEILADDVKCTHGATVGRLDPDLIFYLMSRGISRGDAEQLIVEGFFDPIMQRIPFYGIKERFQNAIKSKMAAINF